MRDGPEHLVSDRARAHSRPSVAAAWCRRPSALLPTSTRDRRAQTIGLFTSVLPLGSIVGPNLGGFILEHWTWREMFIVNVPIGVVVVLGVGLLLREKTVRKVRHIDVPGLRTVRRGD